MRLPPRPTLMDTLFPYTTRFRSTLPLAVRAFRELQRARPDARFAWVGDGLAREQLQREHPDFIFCGVQRGEALARYFASADLLLFPSLSETFGNVTLEAMASGVPTVAFDYGRSEERRVGKECVNKRRSRWSTYD